MRKTVLAFAALSLAVPAAVAAQAPAAERPARLGQQDLTRADAQARASAAFARMDANKDGALDQADRTARQSAMFDRLDTDRDGAISRAEFAAMQARWGEARKARAAARAARGAAASGPISQQAFIERALARFDRADADRDGTLTAAERKAVRDTMRQRWQDRRAARQQG